MTNNLSSDMNKNHQLNLGGMCPYCGTTVATGEHMIICPKCLTPHHSTCWDENGGCTTFGCGAAPKDSSEETEDSINISFEQNETSFTFSHLVALWGYITSASLSVVQIGVFYIINNMPPNKYPQLLGASIILFGLEGLAVILLAMRRPRYPLIFIISLNICIIAFLMTYWKWDSMSKIAPIIHEPIIGYLFLFQGLIASMVALWSIYKAKT